MIYPADRIIEIEGSRKLGISGHVDKINFDGIMEPIRKLIASDSGSIRSGLRNSEALKYFEAEGRFVDANTLRVGADLLSAEKIFIASGARPLIPDIPGLATIDFLTNENVLALTKAPESLAIVGGGYIGVEYAHFFAAMGTKVTIIEMASDLIPSEEPEIGKLLKVELSKRMTILTGSQVTAASQKNDLVQLSLDSGEEISAERILIASGRRSNADLIDAEAAGLVLDKRGFIKTNDYLETNRQNIWAAGDANGKQMFRHVANREAELAWHNATHDHKAKMSYSAAPRAIFTSPQIAAVGLTEAEATKEYEIIVKKTPYDDVSMGLAMKEDQGFTKSIVDKESDRILGFHIIGPYAGILIQEVVNVMETKAGFYPIAASMHIHPALSELIQASFY